MFFTYDVNVNEKWVASTKVNKKLNYTCEISADNNHYPTLQEVFIGRYEIFPTSDGNVRKIIGVSITKLNDDLNVTCAIYVDKHYHPNSENFAMGREYALPTSDAPI